MRTLGNYGFGVFGWVQRFQLVIHTNARLRGSPIPNCTLEFLPLKNYSAHQYYLGYQSDTGYIASYYEWVESLRKKGVCEVKSFLPIRTEMWDGNKKSDYMLQDFAVVYTDSTQWYSYNYAAPLSEGKEYFKKNFFDIARHKFDFTDNVAMPVLPDLTTAARNLQQSLEKFILHMNTVCEEEKNFRSILQNSEKALQILESQNLQIYEQILNAESIYVKNHIEKYLTQLDLDNKNIKKSKFSKQKHPQPPKKRFQSEKWQQLLAKLHFHRSDLKTAMLKAGYHIDAIKLLIAAELVYPLGPLFSMMDEPSPIYLKDPQYANCSFELMQAGINALNSAINSLPTQATKQPLEIASLDLNDDFQMLNALTFFTECQNTEWLHELINKSPIDSTKKQNILNKHKEQFAWLQFQKFDCLHQFTKS